ncbi:uncharacterized protein LOC132746234 [Ruditapes philippinarum]|uniref:uncharacterized protein LOC132746234 n=1 Tax=Ruditapes philippinarum TaxID=129788 RepID=UPI00295BDAC7|nr:uncharacterized protein LOC132746234 [Ruditapes philippinarum]
METFMEKISSKSSPNQLSQFSYIVSGVPNFKRKSNEEQFNYNSKVSMALEEAEQAAVSERTDEARQKIAEAQALVAHRQKLIRLADSSDLGWRLVTEYEANPLADDSDDERRMLKAETRASRKLKAEKQKKSRSAHTAPYRKPSSTFTGHSQMSTATSVAQSTPRRPGLCFTCGKPGHWKGSPECSGAVSNNKISFLNVLKCLPKSKADTIKMDTGTVYKLNNGVDKSDSPVGR